MAVLKMQKISICALKKDRKAILEQLQHLGVLEVDRDKEEDAFFNGNGTGKPAGRAEVFGEVRRALIIRKLCILQKNMHNFMQNGN